MSLGCWCNQHPARSNQGRQSRVAPPSRLCKGLEDAVKVCSHQHLALTLEGGLALLRDADDKLRSDYAGVGTAPVGRSKIER